MPMEVGRYGRQPPHDQRWCQTDLVACIDAVGSPNQELAKRQFRAQQGAGEESALKISPGEKYVALLDLLELCFRSRRCAELTGRHLAGTQTIAIMQDLVANMAGQVIFQPCWLILEFTIQVDGAWRFEKGTKKCLDFEPGIVASDKRFARKPFDL